jgi:hypothetical protein
MINPILDRAIWALNFLGLGVMFFIIDSSYYQLFDERSVLHENAFFWIGLFFIVVGLASPFKFIFQRHINSNSKSRYNYFE